MPDYLTAPADVVETVERIRNAYHAERLRGARIAVAILSEAPKSKGKTTLGECSLWPAKAKPFVAYDFLIWFSHDEWINMPEARQDALADHELCHAVWDRNERKASLRPHDIAEFYEVWRRHGPYLAEYDMQREIVQAAFDLPGLDEDVTEAADFGALDGGGETKIRESGRTDWIRIGPESITMLEDAARRMRESVDRETGEPIDRMRPDGKEIAAVEFSHNGQTGGPPGALSPKRKRAAGTVAAQLEE